MFQAISKLWSRSAAAIDGPASQQEGSAFGPPLQGESTYLPLEIWENVFDRLAPRDLASAACVSRQLRAAADSQDLWSRHAFSLNVRAGGPLGRTKFMCWQAETARKNLLAERVPARHVLRGEYSSVDWSPDSATFVATKQDAAGASKSVIFDVLRGHATGCIEHPPGQVHRAWSHFGGQLALGTSDGSTHVCDLSSMACASLYRHMGGIMYLRWSPDDTKLLSASTDGCIGIINLACPGEMIQLNPPVSLAGQTPQGEPSACWSPCGERVAWVARQADTVVRVCSAVEGTPLFSVGHPSRVKEVAWNADGGRLVSVSTDGDVSIVDGRDGAEVAQVAPGGLATAVAWSPNGQALVSLFTSGDVVITGAAAGDTWVHLRHTGPAEHVSWSPHGSKLAWSSPSKTVGLVDTQRRLEVAQFRQPGVVRAFDWNPSETCLLTVYGGKNIRLTCTVTGNALAHLVCREPVCRSLWDVVGRPELISLSVVSLKHGRLALEGFSPISTLASWWSLFLDGFTPERHKEDAWSPCGTKLVTQVAASGIHILDLAPPGRAGPSRCRTGQTA